MYIIECAPITRGFRKETLSYFASAEPPIGSVVSVPLRNKKVPALILKSLPLEEEKLAVKGASFSLKKLSRQKGSFLFLKETIAAAEDVARFFAGTVGGVLEAFTPQAILESSLRTAAKTEKRAGGVFSARSLQAGIEERVLEYRALIRERFARHESVLLSAPTIEEILFFSRELPRGIEKYCFILHGNMNKKEITDTWKKALLQSHPALIITTPFGLSIPRGDIGVIIIERENSRGYSSLRAPYPDGRVFAEALARKYKCQCLLADTALRVETLYREQSGELERFPSSKLRIQSSAASAIIDMKKTDTGEKKEFAVLSPEAKKIISAALEKNERVVVFAARRGLSPVTLCGDCGTIVECRECHSPVVLHEKGDSPYFLCHRCGERRSAREYCAACGSWNLRALGVGIDRVAEALEKYFPEAKIRVMEKERVKTAARGREMAADFYRTPRAVLLGTEFMLPYLQKPFEHCLIASLDALFGVPDFKMHEKIFLLAVALRHLSLRTFTLQSRNPTHFVLQTAIRGDVASFYREEIGYRKSFRFPPAATLIKLSVEEEKAKAAEAMRQILNLLSGYEVSVFPAFIPRRGGARALSALLRLPEGSWVDDKLLEILKTLPPSVRVEINPDTVV